MKTALILLAKDIGDKAVDAFRPVLAKFAARRNQNLMEELHKEDAEIAEKEDQAFRGGA